MSLDKWIKSEKKDDKKRGKKEPEKKKSTEEAKEIKSIEKQDLKLKKYVLICPKAKCKYQKTIVKRTITEKESRYCYGFRCIYFRGDESIFSRSCSLET